MPDYTWEVLNLSSDQYPLESPSGTGYYNPLTEYPPNNVDIASGDYTLYPPGTGQGAGFVNYHWLVDDPIFRGDGPHTSAYQFVLSVDFDTFKNGTIDNPDDRGPRDTGRIKLQWGYSPTDLILYFDGHIAQSPTYGADFHHPITATTEVSPDGYVSGSIPRYFYLEEFDNLSTLGHLTDYNTTAHISMRVGWTDPSLPPPPPPPSDGVDGWHVGTVGLAGASV